MSDSIVINFFSTVIPIMCKTVHISPLLTSTSTGDAHTQSVLVSVGSLCPGVHKVCLSPLSISGRYGV